MWVHTARVSEAFLTIGQIPISYVKDQLDRSAGDDLNLERVAGRYSVMIPMGSPIQDLELEPFEKIIMRKPEEGSDDSLYQQLSSERSVEFRAYYRAVSIPHELRKNKSVNSK